MREVTPTTQHTANPVAPENSLEHLFADASTLQRVITETSPDFIIITSLNGTIQYINRVLEEHKHTPIKGTSVYNYVTPDEAAKMRECFARVIETGKMDRYDTVYHSPEQGTIHFDCRVAPIVEKGRIVGLNINASDVTHLKRTEQALREAAINHHAIIDQSPVGIISVAPNGAILSANHAFHAMLGYDSPELHGDASLELLHPDDRAASIQSLTDLVSGVKETCKAEKRFRNVNGEYVWTRFSASAIYDDAGKIIRLVCIVEDVTAAKSADERQKMLMRELDHRVKNNLAALLALTEQTIEASDSLEDFESTFIGRVNAMARSHEALANAQWMGLKLQHAVRATLAGYLQEKPPRLEIEGPDVDLHSRMVLPLCLTLHELVTNAVRHGALATLAGRVRLSWNVDGETLHLTWREFGGEAPRRTPAPGVGTELIQGFVKFELHGKVTMQFEPDGLVCTMAIPLGVAE